MPKKEIRRRVRKDEIKGNEHGFKTKSFTNDNDTWKPKVNILTAQFSCTCPASIYKPSKPCKHVKRSVVGMIRERIVNADFFFRLGLKCCYNCLEEKEIFEVCDENGLRVPNTWICKPCISELSNSQNEN